MITPDGVAIDPGRIKIVADMPAPKSLKEAKRVFGFFSWFRKFIPSFAPMSSLCSSFVTRRVFTGIKS